MIKQSINLWQNWHYYHIKPCHGLADWPKLWYIICYMQSSRNFINRHNNIIMNIIQFRCCITYYGPLNCNLPVGIQPVNVTVSLGHSKRLCSAVTLGPCSLCCNSCSLQQPLAPAWHQDLGSTSKPSRPRKFHSSSASNWDCCLVQDVFIHPASGTEEVHLQVGEVDNG